MNFQSIPPRNYVPLSWRSTVNANILRTRLSGDFFFFFFFFANDRPPGACVVKWRVYAGALTSSARRLEHVKWRAGDGGDSTAPASWRESRPALRRRNGRRKGPVAGLAAQAQGRIRFGGRLALRRRRRRRRPVVRPRHRGTGEALARVAGLDSGNPVALVLQVEQLATWERKPSGQLTVLLQRMRRSMSWRRC